MRGIQNTHTKSQDLREIIRTQDGFLTGWNNDNPKSDVGETQLTVLENCIPFRDRLEPRGGLKPQTAYLKKGSPENAAIFDTRATGAFYDDEWDELFSFDGSDILNYGKLDFETIFAYGYNAGVVIHNQKRKGDKIVVSTSGWLYSAVNMHSIIEKRSADYFTRPIITTSTTFGGGGNINVVASSSGTFHYSFYASFVRKVDGVVVSESPIVDGTAINHGAELDGIITPFTLANTLLFYPSDYFDTGFAGTDNMYTHVRYYRSKVQTTSTGWRLSLDGQVYNVGDYEINSLGSSVGQTLDLNVTDGELTTDPSRAVYWLDGYQEVAPSEIFTISSGIYIARDENKKNDFIYCPIGAGDNEKYFGWYNPLFQYGSVEGDITQILDMGSYVVITTSVRTYYVDTVNYSEDESQRSLGVFTPILPNAVLITDKTGVDFNQRNAFVKTGIGSAIGFTSDGEIRELSGYQWGSDLAQGKVHSITKGKIKNNSYYCQAAFVNDAYWLYYREPYTEAGHPYGHTYYYTRTLRLGTTEESGYGFCRITGEQLEGESITLAGSTTGWPYTSNNLRMNTLFIPIKGVLHVLRRQKEHWNTGGDGWVSLMEYTGDKFDNKINKDVVDIYETVLATPSYVSTSYFPILSEIEFPEVTGTYESYFIYFLKSHFHLRADKFAFKVSDETTKGYEITDDKGAAVGELSPVSLSDVSFDMDARAGESEAIQATTEDFSPTSAVTLQRDVQDHRIRITLRGDASGFQLTGMQSHFKRHDRTELDETDTTNDILALNTDLYCRITGKKKNFAVGTGRASYFDVGAPIDDTPMRASADAIQSGTITLTTGPDGIYDTSLYTGLIMGSGSWMEFQAPSITTPSSATIMFWYQSAQIGSSVITGWNSAETGLYKLYTDGSTWFVKNDDYDTDTTIASTESSWTHIAFAFSCSFSFFGFETTNLKVYKNGLLVNTIAIGSALENYIKAPSIRIDGQSLYSDIRMYNKEIDADQMLLYYNNIINNEGDYVNGY